MKKLNTFLISLVLICLLGGAGYGGYRWYMKENPPAESTPLVTIEEVQEQLAAANDSIDALQAELEELQSDYTLLLSQKQNLQIYLNTANETISELQANLFSVTAEKNSLQTQLDELLAAGDTGNGEEVELLLSQSSALENQIYLLNGDISDLTLETETLQEEINTLTGQISTLQDSISFANTLFIAYSNAFLQAVGKIVCFDKFGMVDKYLVNSWISQNFSGLGTVEGDISKGISFVENALQSLQDKNFNHQEIVASLNETIFSLQQEIERLNQLNNENAGAQNILNNAIAYIKIDKFYINFEDQKLNWVQGSNTNSAVTRIEATLVGKSPEMYNQVVITFEEDNPSIWRAVDSYDGAFDLQTYHKIDWLTYANYPAEGLTFHMNCNIFFADGGWATFDTSNTQSPALIHKDVDYWAFTA